MRCGSSDRMNKESCSDQLLKAMPNLCIHTDFDKNPREWFSQGTFPEGFVKIGASTEVRRRFQDLVTTRISVLSITDGLVWWPQSTLYNGRTWHWTVIACRFPFIWKDYPGVCQKWEKSHISLCSVYELFGWPSYTCTSILTGVRRCRIYTYLDHCTLQNIARVSSDVQRSGRE